MRILEPPVVRRLLPALLLALLTLAPVQASAQTKSDVNKAKSAEEEAYQALVDADNELADGLEQLEHIQGEIYNLNWRIGKLENAIAEYGTNVTSLEERARLLVREAYTTGGRNMMTTAFTASNIQDLITSEALYSAAATRDLNQLDQLAAISRQMDRLGVELGDKQVEVEQLKAEQETVVAHLAEVRDKADEVHREAKAKYASVYAKYKAEQRRLAAIRAAQASGPAKGIASATKGVVCPVPNSYFIDTWGYPRSGGRTHKGTDMIASYNSKLYAAQSGSVRLNSHRLGGIQVYIYGDDGVTYYYAHLSKYAPGLSNGQRVSKGQLVGYVGTTGNATGPNIHVGLIVGGRYVNPYPTLRAAC